MGPNGLFGLVQWNEMKKGIPGKITKKKNTKNKLRVTTGQKKTEASKEKRVTRRKGALSGTSHWKYGHQD